MSEVDALIVWLLFKALVFFCGVFLTVFIIDCIIRLVEKWREKHNEEYEE